MARYKLDNSVKNSLSVTKNLKRSRKHLEPKITHSEELVKATGEETIAKLLFVKMCQWLEMLEAKAQGALVRSLFLNVNQIYQINISLA